MSFCLIGMYKYLWKRKVFRFHYHSESQMFFFYAEEKIVQNLLVSNCDGTLLVRGICLTWNFDGSTNSVEIFHEEKDLG